MIKKIREWGGSAGIMLRNEDLNIYNLKIGDTVKITLNKINVKREGFK